MEITEAFWAKEFFVVKNFIEIHQNTSMSKLARVNSSELKRAVVAASFTWLLKQLKTVSIIMLKYESFNAAMLKFRLSHNLTILP